MGVPVKAYTFVDGQTAAGLVSAARLNGDFDPLYNCLDPATGGLEDTNVKAGAKIVCSDRNYSGGAKITGTWEFQTFPTIPDASIPDAKLSANVILAAAFGPHDHVGGDGAAIPEGGLSLSDVVTGDVSTTKHGFCPKAPNDTAKFLRGDGSWNAPGGFYALNVIAMVMASITDAATYYFGGVAKEPETAADRARMYIPRAGTIRVAYIFWNAPGAGAGSNENISVYIRLNNTTDTLIATIGDTANHKIFSKTDLSIAVAQGDYIEIKMVCPTWATNPQNISLGGVVLVE